MKFRHELKHEISYSDYFVLKNRLSAVMQHDTNGDHGTYLIRSLYFDNLYDSALREKVDGVNHREKFRIRSYDYNNEFIRLEKKSKINGLCNKVSAVISAQEVSQIINGDILFMKDNPKPLIQELYLKMNTKCLVPKTLVDYTREAFIFPPGNVRVTLDYDIKTGLDATDFLNPNCITVPTGDHVIILEVKWDEFLPEIIKEIVLLKGRKNSAFSKYATCRIYG
ncbi:MAG: polyphosphate polymerase domain-containing protein [Eubacteriales bacterium]